MSSTQSPLGPPGLHERFADLLLADVHARVPETEHAPPIEAGRSAPPPELLAEMARADAAHARMAAAGHTVRFGDGTAPLQIELCALDGAPVLSLSAAEAVALACPATE